MQQKIYVMNSDGSGQTRLTYSNYDQAHTWSPDCTKIAFASFRDGNGNIYVINADGTGESRLNSDPSEEIGPSWSPNGTKIAFSSDRNGNFDIYTMDADGSNQTRLTNDTATEYAPAWSPDSTKIAFLSDRDGTYYKIYSMNTDGSGQTALTTGPGTDNWPDWNGPTVTSITPSSGKRGTTVKIKNLKGKGFANGAKVALFKGTKKIKGTAVTWMNLTRMRCKVAIPATAPTGKWGVRVINPGGVSATLAKAFRVK
jgi:Tol biopolymer transport system component